jgi:uncharacterized membrane protein YfcA
LVGTYQDSEARAGRHAQGHHLAVVLQSGLAMASVHSACQLFGAAAGGAFAGSTSAEVLKLLLGLILIAAALKAFWRRGH